MPHSPMKNKIIFLLITSLLLPTATFALDWQKLIRGVEEQYNGQSSRSKMHMRVITEHWQRSLTMEAWSLERDRFLVRILQPAKEKGGCYQSEWQAETAPVIPHRHGPDGLENYDDEHQRKAKGCP